MYYISSYTHPSSLFTSISLTGSCFGVVCIVRDAKLQLSFEEVFELYCVSNTVLLPVLPLTGKPCWDMSKSVAVR